MPTPGTFVEVACLYLSRRLLNGEIGGTGTDRFIAAELTDTAPKILQALEV